jgi:hypothetical protein
MVKPETQTPNETALAHTVEAASRISTCGRTLLYSAIKAGDLKARKIGRRTIILDAELRDWLASLPTREIA